jgi:Tfp pilus assembly protein PilZ
MGTNKKTFIKRPFLHYVIIAAYILAPVVNLVLLRMFMDIPFSTVIENLFKGYGILACLWLFTAPLVGIGFLFVHRVSWYLFLSHSSVILIDYILKWATQPAYYWQNIPRTHQFLMMAGNLALLLVIGYVIQRDFRAPYFQALPRSWRESKRIPIRHVISVNGTEQRITDLSQGGCFIAEPELGLQPGERVSLAFESDTLSIQCQGEIRRAAPDGYGVQFLGLPAGKRRDIKRMLKKRFSLRYEVNLDCTWSFDSRKRNATILNISNGGCYLGTDVSGIEPGTYGNIAFTLRDRGYHFIAKVAWINDALKHEKPAGFGVQFTHRHARTVRAILRSYGKRVLTR